MSPGVGYTVTVSSPNIYIRIFVYVNVVVIVMFCQFKLFNFDVRACFFYYFNGCYDHICYPVPVDISQKSPHIIFTESYLVFKICNVCLTEFITEIK